MNLVLLDVTETEARPVFRVKRFPALIGNRRDSDVCIDRDGVSRRHAGIVRRESRFYLVDLGSRNGTRLHRVRGGDLVTRPVPVAESPERVDDALLGEANELQDGLYVGVGAGLLQCVLEPEAPLARHERESDESAPRASGGVRTAGWIGAGILLAAVTLALGLRAGPVDLRPSLRGAGIGAPAARPVMPASRPWDGRSVDHAAR